MKRTFIIDQIKLPLDSLEGDAVFRAKKKIGKIISCPQDVTFSVRRRSLDARDKRELRFVWSINMIGDFSDREAEKLAANGIRESRGRTPVTEISSEDDVRATTDAPPVIVGAGPAGLFCALTLAEAGYRPILIERGDSVADRKRAIDRFYASRILDCESNIQFGAGGAGTFSDGKLVCRTNDEYTDYVLGRLAALGAPENIVYEARPHIGTDVLPTVVENAVSAIEAAGGRVLFRTRMDGIKTVADRATAIETSLGEIACGGVVLACGHSARDTYRMLIGRGFAVESKAFSVGVRIEHLRENIDRAMYGDFAGHPALGAAEYSLSCNTSTRGVYSFCMCPGGEVLAAASEEGMVAVNGMSRRARDGRNSNAAIAVSVFREDYGCDPLRAIEFQRDIERAAYAAGGGAFCAPICTVGDFLAGKCASEPSSVTPTYMNGDAVSLASPDAYLPEFVASSLRGALPIFGRKIRGYDDPNALITGAETRTSAPIRILRGSDGAALGFDNIYPCGEGAGYAGGISSAAIDGIRTAEAYIRKFKRSL